MIWGLLGIAFGVCVAIAIVIFSADGPRHYRSPKPGRDSAR